MHASHQSDLIAHRIEQIRRDHRHAHGPDPHPAREERPYRPAWTESGLRALIDAMAVAANERPGRRAAPVGPEPDSVIA